MDQKMKKPIVSMLILTVVAGCLGPAGKSSSPNMIQRANILSSGSKSITIEHSQWGKPIAFGMAEKHCGQMGKEAVYGGGTKQSGPDLISTWSCE